MERTARAWMGMALVIAVGALSLFAWQAFSVATLGSPVAAVWIPFLWYSALAIVYVLGAVVWNASALRVAGTAFFFLPSLLFFRELPQIAVLIVSAGLAYLALLAIRAELRERLRFHFYRSVRAGQFLFVLALSLSLASAYSGAVRHATWEDLVPRFRLGEGVSSVVLRVAGLIDPNLRVVTADNATVDEFLTQTGDLSLKPQGSEIPGPSSEQASEAVVVGSLPGLADYLASAGIDRATFERGGSARELYLATGRKQLAELVGRPVAGDEKIATIFSETLQRKLLGFLSGEGATPSVAARALPYFLTLLLFLSLLSVGSLVAPLWIGLAHLLFDLVRRLGWVRMVRATVEQEQLAE